MLLKIGNSYKALIKFDNLDWCWAIKNVNKVAKTNRFMKPVYKDLKKLLPRLLEPCPFEGLIKLINIASPETVMSILPSGDYLAQAEIKDIVRKLDIFVEVGFRKNF